MLVRWDHKVHRAQLARMVLMAPLGLLVHRVLLA